MPKASCEPPTTRSECMALPSTLSKQRGCEGRTPGRRGNKWITALPKGNLGQPAPRAPQPFSGRDLLCVTPLGVWGTLSQWCFYMKYA